MSGFEVMRQFSRSADELELCMTRDSVHLPWAMLMYQEMYASFVLPFRQSAKSAAR